MGRNDGMNGNEMKMRRLPGTAIVAALAAGALSAASVTIHPKVTDEALVNPDMGFMH